MRPWKTTFPLVLGVLLVAAGLGGCRRTEIELGDVHGVVLLDGDPLPDATIRFIPVEGGRAALGRTDAKGEYKMLYSARSSGALVGSVRVEITTADPDAPQSKEVLPARYNSKSELVREVTSGGQMIDFDLKSR